MDDVIYRQALRDAMYHEAFEVDSDMQKWDSGCWIRYKLFENVIDKIPSVDAVEVVRCKNCDNFQTDWETAFANGRHYCAIMDSIMPPEGFCSYGERKTDE